MEAHGAHELTAMTTGRHAVPSALTASARASAQAVAGQRLKGFAIFLCALTVLAVLDALAKDLVLRNSAPLVNLVRYGVVLLMAVGALWHRHAPFVAAPRERLLLLGRGFMLGMVGVCFMPALQYLPLAEATAIYFLAPLIVVLLCPLVLREKVSAQQIAAVLMGLAGMLLIVRPGGDLSPVGSGLMLVAAFSYACVQLLTRKLAGRTTGEQQYLYAAIVCAVMGTIVLAIYWPTIWPGAWDIGGMLLIGLLSGIGQYLIIRAFALVPASALAPFNYFHLLLAVIFSMTVFHQTPPLVAVIGMLLIAGAGLSLTVPLLLARFAGRARP